MRGAEVWSEAFLLFLPLTCGVLPQGAGTRAHAIRARLDVRAYVCSYLTALTAFLERCRYAVVF